MFYCKVHDVCLYHVASSALLGKRKNNLIPFLRFNAFSKQVH